VDKRLTNIDSEIVTTLIQPDQYGKLGKDAPIKKIIRYGNIDFEPEVDIAENRTVDLLVTIPQLHDQKVIVEVENDRKFDAGEILRKIKRERKVEIPEGLKKQLTESITESLEAKVKGKK